MSLSALALLGPAIARTEDCVRDVNQPLYTEGFAADLSNWVSEGPNQAEVGKGKLVIRTREKTADGATGAGQYLWFNQDLPADFRVEFDFTPVSPSGFFLLNFCTTDTGGEDIERADCNLRKNTGKLDMPIPDGKAILVVPTKLGGRITLTSDGVSFMDLTIDDKLSNRINGTGKFGFRKIYESLGEHDNVRSFALPATI